MKKYLILLLFACNQTNTPKVNQTSRGIDWFTTYIDGQEKAIEYTKKRMEDYLKEDLSKLNVRVFWVQKSCPGKDVPSIYYREKCYYGYTFSCREMYVAVRDLFGQTSLSHEMTHCILRHLGRDSDRFHKKKELWYFVEQIKKEMRDQDL